jgi:PhzF family phenazine biosynthesis protein
LQLDLIDVFATGPLTGNPLAVVRGAETMSDGEMLALTRWLGYSETTFLLSPDDPAADYRLRIFYPSGELPFAGHPTLGSCHAWLEAGGIPKRDGAIVQQCGAGLIEISAQGGMLHFKAPPLLRKGPLDEGATVEAARLLGISLADIIEAVHADNGPGWVLLRATGAYRASQGHAVGADGLVYCRQEADGSIWIGGMVRSVASSALLHRPI